MALTISQLVSKVETLTSDVSRRFGNERIGTGNGSRTAYYIAYPPVKADSQTIYVDGVAQTETTHYTIDDEIGLVTFISAPSTGAAITTDYTGLHIASTDLQSIVEISVPLMYVYYQVTEFSMDGSDVSPSPSSLEESLLAMHGRLVVVQTEAIKHSREGIRTARTGVSVDTTNRSRSLRAIAETLEQQFKLLATRAQLANVHELTIDDIKR